MSPSLAPLSDPAPRVRYAAIKALRIQSERDPSSLYPHSPFFLDLLESDHSIFRWNAILIVGNLARVDIAGRIDAVLDRYLRPIRGPQLIDAANTIKGAAAIALAKPALAPRIARAILGVERATYATPECRNVAIGHALRALARLLPILPDPRPVRDFAARQRDNPRPAVRREAAKLTR